MPALEITLFGGFRVRLIQGDVVALSTRKTQALLAYLALPPGQAHPRDKLAALLWGDLGQHQARANLRQALAALRRALGDTGALQLRGESVALDPGAVSVDARMFESRVAGPTEGLPEALGLYQGDLLAGLTLHEAPFEEWLLAERERLRELALEAAARLLAHQRRHGQTETAIQTGLKLLTLDPLQESVHRMLMRLYVEAGRRGMALRQYQLCLSVLARELRAEPEADTKALYQEILRSRAVGAERANAEHGPALAAEPAPRPPIDAPATTVPFVGREAELARLSVMLDAACSSRGGLVGIFGDAGVGKSRLAAEVLELAARRGARVLVGHCYETEQRLPFGVWIDALRSGGVTSDVAVLDGLGSVWRAELARILPEVSEKATATRESGDVMSLYEALSQLVGRLAARQPLVVLLEDWHWVDEMSLRLTPFLARRVQSWSALIIGTVRDEETTNRPLHRQIGDQLARERLVARLRLSPLSRDETLTLARHVLPAGSTARASELVWRASEGNPFMAVETARVLGDRPDVAAGDALTASAPVRHLIQGRLDRLAAPAQALVAVAAVIGRQFSFPVLQRAADLPEWEAAEAMEELVRRRIFHQAGDGFEFVHDRIREVAQARILSPRRALLHRRIAETLEVRGRDPDGDALAIGSHYREGQVWDKAAAFLARAGNAAAARGAAVDAVTCYEQALDALKGVPDGRGLQEQAFALHFSTAYEQYQIGDPIRALESVRSAEALAAQLDDPGRMALLMSWRPHTLVIGGHYREALREGARGVEAARAIGNPRLEADARTAQSMASYALGEYLRSIEHARAALALLEGGPRTRPSPPIGIGPEISTRALTALSLARIGDFPKAMRWGEDTVALAEASGHPRSRVSAYHSLGTALLAQGEFERAALRFEQALALCEDRPLAWYATRVLAALASTYVLGGDVERGLPLLERALAQAESSDVVLDHTRALNYLATSHLHARRLDEARRIAVRALALSRAREERGDEAWTLEVLGEIAAWTTPPALDEAVAYLGAALDLATQLEMRSLQARCHLGLGQAQQRAGRAADARGHLGSAADLFRALGMRSWLGRAEQCLAALP